MASTLLDGRNPSVAGFRIVVDGPMKSFFVSGDTIKGRVVLNRSGSHDIGRVTVKLWGRSKTKLYRSQGNGGKSTYRGRGILFWKVVTLYEGSYTHSNPDYQWPFEFDFPATAEPSRMGTGGDAWDEAGNFRSSDQHNLIPLPPTFEHKSENFWAPGFDCFVEYKLEAAVYKPSGSLLYQATNLIYFVQLSDRLPEPASSNVPRERRLFLVRSNALAPPPSEKPSLTKRFLHISRDEKPSVQFRILLYSPKEIQFGEPASLTLKLEHLQQSATVLETPVVSIVRGSILLVQRTSVRSAVRTFGAYTNDAEEKFSWRGVNCKGSFSEITDYQTALQLPGLQPSRCVPSFVTYNIRRHYAIKVDLTLTCADKELQLNADVPIELLRPKLGDADQDVPSYENAAADELIMGSGGPLTTLPSYEQAAVHG